MDKQTAIEELKRRREISLQLGGKERIERHHKRGHLTARERIDKLVDPGTFTEIGMLELFPMPGEEDKLIPRNKLHGFGKINGRIMSIQSDDSTVLAGTGGRRGGVGRMRGYAALSAPAKGCPVIRFGESGGVHLQSVQGSIGVLAVTYPARALLNPRKVPHITAIMGYCFGDPTWAAAISEFVIQVKGTCMAVSGPRVLGVALEERITPEELGGWKLHAEVTGQVDAFAEDDEYCAQIIRELIDYLPSNCEEEPPYLPTEDPADRKPDEMMDIIPDDAGRNYDMHEVIRALVDNGRYFLLKPYFAKAIIVCLARMDGRVVGIMANQTMHNAGAIGPDECDKATDFIVLCDSFNIPLVFLVDTPGFMGGKESERKRLPTKIMQCQEAMAFVTVPKITLIVRKAYGLAAAIMCGPNSNPDFIAGLINADIRSMPPETINTVYRRRIEEAEDPEVERRKLISLMEQQSTPWEAASAGLLDDVLDPRDARKYVINSLDILRGQRGDFISKKYLQTWPTGF